MNSPQFLEKLGDLYLERGIKPEVESSMPVCWGSPITVKTVGPPVYPCHYQLCLGVLGGMPATVENLVSGAPSAGERHLVGLWRGKSHLPILYAALALGGHIRVGLEDNVCPTGVPATNVQLVEQAVQAVRTGKQPVTCSGQRNPGPEAVEITEEKIMKVVRLADAFEYPVTGHFDMRALRLHYKETSNTVDYTWACPLPARRRDGKYVRPGGADLFHPGG